MSHGELIILLALMLVLADKAYGKIQAMSAIGFTETVEMLMR